jgi:hypothetical protein
VTLEEHADAIGAAIKAAADDGFHMFDDCSRPLSIYATYLEGRDEYGVIRSLRLVLPRCNI